MKKFILLSFTLLITMGLWAQVHTNIDEVKVKPPKFAGVQVTTIQDEQSIADYIAANMQYPEEDLKHNIEGTEVIVFTVGEDGTLSNFEVVNSVSKQMDNEIIRVLKTTTGMWYAGTNNDNTVEMDKEIAIACKIANSEIPNKQTDFKVLATDYFKRGAKLLYVKHHPKRALNKFDEGIRYLPYDANLLVMRGYAKFTLGDRDGAIEDWRIVKEKTDIDNLEELTSTYQDLDGYAELMEVLDR
ncbi:energy transducer TonB [Mangrovibacterium lignilyticum]|uniref:energy transducer TonB n=1 Tax=Mangrovibacterium lignilyticum TaxID=2668052 RepID=UPI0013D0403D|nr:energy transducer TonB [Mangrovibacterium lignilyticum]